jgi:signal peptidase I
LAQGTQKKKKVKTSWLKDVVEIAVFLGLAVLLVFAFNWILAAALRTDSPLVIVTSESMEPIYYGSNRGENGAINDIRKDMLVVKGVEPTEIQVGDTIVFNTINNTGIPVVHRVTRVYYNTSTDTYWFVTKGDNVNNDVFIYSGSDGSIIDELHIHEDRVVGKVIGRIPYLGGIINYFKSPTGRIVLIAVVGGILVLTFLFGSDEEEEEKELFKEEPEEHTKGESDDSFWEKLKKGYKFYQRKRHFIIPIVILAVIVFIPIVDTLDANWGSHFGVVNVEYQKAERVADLPGGAEWFIFSYVTINNPGHWHQKLQHFTIEISNSTTGEVYATGAWTSVYVFEGTKRMNVGAWMNQSFVVDGAQYTLTITATLQSKFGRTWYDALSTNFILNI